MSAHKVRYLIFIETLPRVHRLHGRINTLRPRQNGRHFADDIFKCIFFNENVWISLKISLKFVLKGPINNIPALVQIMAWRHPGDKPLSEPMLVDLPTHICVARPQWVKSNNPNMIMHSKWVCIYGKYCTCTVVNVAIIWKPGKFISCFCIFVIASSSHNKILRDRHQLIKTLHSLPLWSSLANQYGFPDLFQPYLYMNSTRYVFCNW